MDKEATPSQPTCDYQADEYSNGSMLPKNNCIFLVCHNGIWEERKMFQGCCC